jgi:demethoxyubiquinone hydroxylase (CLK1/Coq7/Cat5 family)
MNAAVSAEEKAAITAHLNRQLAALQDPDDVVMDLESAIEQMMLEACRAERALHKGDYDAARDILLSAAKHVLESLE